MAHPPAPHALSGRLLNTLRGINAKHALYRRDGKWYHCLVRFPGALFDPSGYVVFKTRDEYEASPRLQRGVELHVIGGIASVPNYVRVN